MISPLTSFSKAMTLLLLLLFLHVSMRPAETRHRTSHQA
jgi:hypothetical protein